MQQIALSLDHARDRGALGMERAAEKANRTVCNWTELALNALLLHVQSLPVGAEFIVEDVRLAIEGKLPAPTDLRAWGAVTQAAIKRMYIAPTGDFAAAKSSNASPKALYRHGGAL